MRPLIVAATIEEIKESIPFLDKNNIPYLITGVGMVKTTYALTKYLTLNSCEGIVNVGIAGAIDKNIPLGSILEIETDIFTELGAEDDQNFIPIEKLGLGEATYSKIPSQLLKTTLPKCIGITVNMVHGAESSIEIVKSLFPNISLESMEGAAIFFTANEFKVPAIQVRAISNYVEKRDKSTWNIPLAIINLNTWLRSHIQNAY